MARSIWNGCLAVGDLRVPVKLFGAVAGKQVRFREVHVKDGAPIEHRRVDPGTGREVPYEHVVRGSEAGDGEFVVLDDDELRSVDGPSAKTVDVEAFVPAEPVGSVDPVFYEKPYHLGPRDGSEGGDRLLHDALARTGRVGIGRIVLRTRERLVALHALGDGLLGLSTLRFADEVVAPESFDAPEPSRAPSGQRGSAGAGEAQGGGRSDRAPGGGAGRGAPTTSPPRSTRRWSSSPDAEAGRAASTRPAAGEDGRAAGTRRGGGSSGGARARGGARVRARQRPGRAAQRRA